MHVFVASDDYLPEYRYQQEVAMDNAKAVIEEVDKEFKKLFNREYGGLLASYMMDDAEVAIVSMGNISNTVRMTVRGLREDGIKAGAVKIRVFRPFPQEALCNTLSDSRLVIVLDRAVSSGAGGIVYPELLTAVSNLEPRPCVQDYILGLAGRQVTVENLSSLIKESLTEYRDSGSVTPVRWIDVRGL
jgi:pyruvate/2-oxoacid:ferredoxin oxidoreductase alpha subunit